MGTFERTSPRGRPSTKPLETYLKHRIS